MGNDYIYSLEELKAACDSLEKDLDGIRNSKSNSKEYLKQWIEEEIERLCKQKKEELEKGLEEIDIRFKKEYTEKVEFFMKNFVAKCEVFISKNKHSNEEHEEMVSVNNLYGSFTLDVQWLSGSSSAEKAENLLTKIYIENIQNWRKIFGARKEIHQTPKCFLNSITKSTSIPG